MARKTDAGRSAAPSHTKGTISREQEYELVQRWSKHGDTSARDLLVRAQFQHVVAIARRYKRYTSATLSELIAEGNFGLVGALSKFDPERGTRFATYAVYWIRAYMSQYLVRSRSLVTSGIQSKALSKIRRTREQIVRANGESGNVNDQVAERLALAPEKLHSLLERMDAHDVPWDTTTEDAASGALSVSAEDRLIAAETGNRLAKAVASAVSGLDARERYVVERRLMAHREEELSLAEIGRRFGVSRERARQLQNRALRKVKAALSRLSIDGDSAADRRAA